MIFATDIANFLACHHLTALDRAEAAGGLRKPFFADAGIELLKKLGLQHEQSYLHGLTQNSAEVVEIPGDISWDEATARTREALRRGVSAVYQATLHEKEWGGRADFLVRVEQSSSLGPWSYEVVETKLARSAKARALVQLCFYSDLLSRMQGAEPQWMHVVLGGGRGSEKFQVQSYIAYFRKVRSDFGQAWESPKETYPEPVENCNVCSWFPVCDKRRRDDDDLSLVAGLTRRQRKVLVGRDVATVALLAEMVLPPVPKIDGIGDTALLRIREQARLQYQGRQEGRLIYELLQPVVAEKGLAALPAPSPGDIFLDLEGDPYSQDQGLEYLFGAVTVPEEPGSGPSYQALWSFDSAAEKDAFEKFIADVMERWKRFPAMHIYHYAPYEATVIKRLVGQYGTCTEPVDQLLRSGVFVDLYRVVAQGLRASVESYSIKKLEPLYGYTRDLPLRQAVLALQEFESVLAFGKGEEATSELLASIESYNRDDVDYVLWGDNGKPLGLVEAKRTRRDARVGQQQAKLYADCLEKQFGLRPIIFYSNGYEHWLWDDQNYPPRSVQGFFKKGELELLIQRRETRLPLASAEIDPQIVERFYQSRAIRRMCEAFEKDHDRKSLIVMATGAGKTRTIIALCDLLMRCHWVKRVLFLADRVALVNQAVNAFKKHLPASSPVNLVTEKDAEGRVFVSTYPTMMRLIDDSSDGQRRFGVGHFDLVIIDEAHRSVYQKYRAIFEYFDSFLVGLTATPKDEVDRNTYNLFELETGIPTDSYGLDQAVKDHFLVPPKSVSVPVKFQREGIQYDQLSEDEKEEWDALEWNDEGDIPDHVEAAAVNKWLFNKNTVDKVLEHLMTRGGTVASGERLGKTIIFAKNHDHAVFIAERFDANYPQYKGAFARVVDFQVEYAQSLIDDLSNPNRAPHIAISVDMLDTGIDIPEILNLVFFKLVRSKTKFWQMVGRGTRLSRNLFGPGMDKEFFYIFDYCQNLEFFSQNPETTEGSSAESLGKKLFKTRVELIAELDKTISSGDSGGKQAELRSETAEFLRGQVAAMNVNNFIVRPKRRLVERYAEPKAWENVGTEQQAELSREVAGLPSELIDDDQEAKQFDLLMLRLQLAVLKHETSYERLRKQVIEIAGLLEEKANIPMVQQQMEIIQEIQTDDFWQDVTTPMLENVRKRLRSLVKLIEKGKRITVYTDFGDMLGDETIMELPGFGSGADFERFRAKARQFLKAHEDHAAIHRLRFNEPLKSADVRELERMLLEAGAGTSDDIKRARDESYRLGLFLRSLVGLDREAAKRAFDGFLRGKTLTANQIEFVNMIVDHLTQRGWMDPSLLYESPFTDFSPRGVEGIFDSVGVTHLLAVLDSVREHASV